MAEALEIDQSTLIILPTKQPGDPQVEISMAGHVRTFAKIGF